MTDDQVAQAQALRDKGLSYRKIGIVVGVPYKTIYYRLNPEYQERHKTACVAYRSAHPVDKEAKSSYMTEYRRLHSNEPRYREVHCGSSKRYRRAHGKEIRAYNKWYRESHRAEYAAHNAARRAAILGATAGNLAEIAEIYRRAQESPKVRCYLCGQLIEMGNRHVDHIVPLSKGGAHRPSNLAIACGACNVKKGNKMPREAGILL